MSAVYVFNWLSDLGLLLTGFLALYGISKYGEARIDGWFSIARITLLFVVVLGTIYVRSEIGAGETAVSVALLAVSLAAVIGASISTKLIKVGKALDTASDARVPDVVKTMTPNKEDGDWALIRKLVEFSDWDMVFVLTLFAGIVNQNWSPLFVILGTQMGVFASAVGQFFAAALEMKTRDTGTDEDEDKKLLIIAICSAVLTTIAVGTNLFSVILPGLVGWAPVSNIIAAALITLIAIVTGVILHGKMANFANDDRVMDFISWTAAFSLTGMALLMILATMSPIIKGATIVVVIIVLVTLLIKVTKTEFLGSNKNESTVEAVAA
uniref:Uncharacterized protein n=1 Tax=candidate division WWE3 bacterium TaxID=2053526 RepID=A0A7C4TJ68_UNCKA